ncbi:MAG: ATP-dependent helicase, partial [Actinobacteria bacterium]|nr:ATP-dependent helicase [Actinomycetota bacterium]
MNAASALQTLAAALDGGGEVRAGQIAMAEAVAQAVRDERPLVVQAGTGTGKSWAYLTGALLGTADSGGRVIVATVTKALQDQLAGKDLPAIAAIGLRSGLTWAVLKGRSNYLCRQAALEATRESEAPALDLEGGTGSATGKEVARLVAWAQDSKTGDRAELDFEPRAAAWSSVSVGSDQCPGAQECPSG